MMAHFLDDPPFGTRPDALEAAGFALLSRVLAAFQEAGGNEAGLARALETLQRSLRMTGLRLWRQADGGPGATLVASAGTVPPGAPPLLPLAAAAGPGSRPDAAASRVISSLDQFVPPEIRDWARGYGVAGFVVQPLVSPRGVLGVLEACSTSVANLAEQLPPWGRVLTLLLEHTDVQRGAAACQEFAQTLTRLSPAAVIGLDADGLVRLWNPAAERLFGWKASDTLARPLRIIPAARRAEFDELQRHVLSGRAAAAIETVRQRSDGAAVPVSTSAAPQFDPQGNVTGYIEVLSDTSQRSRAARLVQMQQRVLEILAGCDSLADAAAPVLQTICQHAGWSSGELWTLDSRREMLQIAGAWETATATQRDATPRRAVRERPLGQGLPELICRQRQPTYFADVPRESDPGRERSPVLDCRAGYGIPLWHRQEVLGALCFQDSALGEPDADLRQTLQAIGGTLSNYIRLKRAEASLAEVESKLRQAQKMDAVGLLAGGIAHDFNNVLTVILSYSEIAGEEVEPDHPAHEMLTEIHHAGQRAASLTRRLLTFSRQQAESVSVLDLNEMVKDMERMLRRLIGTNVTLDTELDRGLGAVRADASQIDQVLVNFVVNARDAMPEGGQITVSTRHESFSSARAHAHPGARAGDYVVLTVADTGSGMDEATKARIFEPFFTTKGVGRGTGMGLATVAGIVHQSGGFLDVQTAPGEGTAMSVYLPRVREALATQVFDASPATCPGGSESILVVEEDEVLRTLVRRIMQARGYSALEAGDADEALELVRRASPPVSLVLTALALPGMGGDKLAARIKVVSPHTKVLFVVGSADDQQLADAQADVTVLQKPFTSDQLARTTRQVLDSQSPASRS